MPSSERVLSAPTEITLPAATPPPGHRRAAKILVIDDEPYLRSFMRLALERAGYTVSEAPNGLDGMRVYEEFRPDCVITDLLMPEKEGIETIMEMRRHSHRARIIAMSGGGDLHAGVNLRTARHLGADATLHKPFSAADLIRAVEGAEQ